MEASAPVSVSITRTSDNVNTTANGQVTVAEHDALTPQGTTINTFTNQPLNNVVVATFSDADTTTAAGDLPASINWGDGTTTTGSVSGSAGSFTVTGSHTYTAPGTDNVQVTLSDDAPGPATATANTTGTVSAGTLASQEVLTTATEHVALADSTTVVTFTDTQLRLIWRAGSPEDDEVRVNNDGNRDGLRRLVLGGRRAYLYR